MVRRDAVAPLEVSAPVTCRTRPPHASSSVEIVSLGTTVDIDGQTGVTIDSKVNDVALTGATNYWPDVFSVDATTDIDGNAATTVAATALRVSIDNHSPNSP